MHTVLNVQQVHVLWEILLHTHEQTLLVLELRCHLRQDGRWQLLRVTNKDTLGATVLERDEGAQLNTLSRLVNDDCLKLNVHAQENLVS